MKRFLYVTFSALLICSVIFGSFAVAEIELKFLGKMTNQMLRGIRVQSKEELADRIYKYFDEVNATSVVHHWKYKMDEIDPDEKVSVGLAI